MEKLEGEEICQDCQMGIAIENCRTCLFNVFREMDKYPPFTGDDDKDDGKKD